MTENQVLVLTGTSRGIGRYLAEHYCGQGWTVAGCARSESDFSHDNYHHQNVDVTSEDAVVAWISSIKKEFGRIDGVINNAGAANMNHALLTPGKTVDRLLEVNFKGTFLVCRETAKVMQRHKSGRIVNFSSVAVSLSLEGEAVYAASKSAVETYSRVLAKELAKLNITVNVIAPAPVKTDLIAGVPEEAMRRLIDQLAIKRYATFEDIVNVTDFYLSPNSSFITGQVLTLGSW